ELAVDFLPARQKIAEINGCWTRYKSAVNKKRLPGSVRDLPPEAQPNFDFKREVEKVYDHLVEARSTLMGLDNSLNVATAVTLAHAKRLEREMMIALEKSYNEYTEMFRVYSEWGERALNNSDVNALPTKRSEASKQREVAWQFVEQVSKNLM